MKNMNSSSGKFDFNAFSSSRYLLNWALATILFVILSSCQKEETLISGKSAMSKAENPHAWYLRYMASKPGQVTPRGDMLTVSQALEYLNDGMNFLYCRPDDQYQETVLVPLDEEYNVAFLDNPNDITEQDNLYDQLLFGNYSGFQNYNECLSVNEMNFFYEEMNELAADVLPSPSGNYVISNIEVGYERILLDFETAIGHSMLVVRSTKTITDEEHMDPIQLPD